MPPEKSAFREALTKGQPEQLTGQAKVYLDYALSTNERARSVIASVQQFVPDLTGKRLLDVGAGYGGVCIQAALEGARPVGIEISSRLLELARLNVADHTGVHVQWESADIFSRTPHSICGPFDVITSDNVIEHASYPERFLHVLSGLLAPDGILYLTIPNAFSLGQVLQDCHYGLFGITLLDPDDAQFYLESHGIETPYGVTDYWKWPQYRSEMRRQGLQPKLLNALTVTPGWEDDIRGKLAMVRQRTEELRTREGLSPALRGKLLRRLEQYADTVDDDLNSCVSRYGSHFSLLMVRDYLTEVWFVVARRSDAAWSEELS